LGAPNWPPELCSFLDISEFPSRDFFVGGYPSNGLILGGFFNFDGDHCCTVRPKWSTKALGAAKLVPPELCSFLDISAVSES